MLLLVGALIPAAPLSAQRAATGGAVVEVPTVSELDIVSHEGTVEAAGVRTGVFQIRVRANHAWKVVLGASGGASGLAVRVAGESSSYRALEPGAEAVVASGERGEVVVEVAYRWDPSASAVASLPLTYTLASL